MTFLSKLKFIGKAIMFIGKAIGWITPNGLHLIYKLINIKGKANIKIDDVSITDESDDGFKATLKMTVKSKNPEALTTVKTEIINKPPINI